MKTISFCEFSELVDTIKNQASDKQLEDPYNKFYCQELIELVKVFSDKTHRNILRWLIKKPCIFYDRKLGDHDYYVEVDDDYETMYDFLLINKLHSQGRELNNTATAFLKTILEKSIEKHRGDEEYSNYIPIKSNDDCDDVEDDVDDDNCSNDILTDFYDGDLVDEEDQFDEEEFAEFFGEKSDYHKYLDFDYYYKIFRY